MKQSYKHTHALLRFLGLSQTSKQSFYLLSLKKKKTITCYERIDIECAVEVLWENGNVCFVVIASYCVVSHGNSTSLSAPSCD